MKKFILLLVLVTLLLTGCRNEDNRPPATFDVRGVWVYRMSELDKQSTAYDTGTITLAGDQNGGEFTLVSDKGGQYSGIYIVSGIAFSIESDSDFIVQGSFPDENNLFGTWETGTTGGLWTAVRLMEE